MLFNKQELPNARNNMSFYNKYRTKHGVLKNWGKLGQEIIFLTFFWPYEGEFHSIYWAVNSQFLKGYVFSALIVF